jgi:membrane fusion protein, copper/silver efflux system
MKRISVAVLTLLMLGAGFGAGLWYAKRAGGGAAESAKGGRKILYYVDPMHPAYKSDKPGIAPDCGMKLEPVYEDGGPADAAGAAEPTGKVLYYHDPQDPAYRSDKPGLNPETGNDLIAVYESANFINISTEKQQLIGVRYATVEPMSGVDELRVNGRVVQDETKITRIHPKIEGWIQKVHVDFMGQLVKQGDPLLTIYSPEMLATQQEYLLALRARDTLKAGGSREAYENSELMIEAARRRLELWDLGAAQIDELERTRKTVRTITLYSPAAGYVISRNAFASQRVMPETELYAIADLSRVWIMADVFEADAGKVRPGSPAVVSLPYDAGRDIRAKVSYIQPQIDAATRTLKVRLEAPNPGLALKPDMFVQVAFQFPVMSRLAVPADAVINTGLRKTVFVDRGEGNLEPRQVETGQRFGDRIQIINGLRAGERIVTAGAFLIDSEAQLKNPGQNLGAAAPAQPATGAKPSPAGDHQHD